MDEAMAHRGDPNYDIDLLDFLDCPIETAFATLLVLQGLMTCMEGVLKHYDQLHPHTKNDFPVLAAAVTLERARKQAEWLKDSCDIVAQTEREIEEEYLEELERKRIKAKQVSDAHAVNGKPQATADEKEGEVMREAG